VRREVLIAIAAAFALADASIVTLALPPIIAELDASVEGAAAVIGIYTAVLAVVAGALRWAGREGRRGVPAGILSPKAGAAGLALFAAASTVCGLAQSLEVLIAFRALQAAGAGVALVSIFGQLRHRRRWWAGITTVGIAAGPALGGALTQLIDWRAIFLAQVPVVAVAAWALAPGILPRERAPGDFPEAAPMSRAPIALAALALVSAALTAVLFLAVLLLVSGWSLSPLAAAAVVSVLPLAATVTARAEFGDAQARAGLGAVLVGAGTLVLATVPREALAWVVLAQVLAGTGMGLALPALSGRLLPERAPGDAAGLLAVRHLGITVALFALSPVASAQLDRAIEDAQERGAALVLDARLPPLDKVALAGTLVAGIDPVDPREQLRSALAENADRFADDPEQAAAYADLRERADETLVEGVNDAFRLSFLITGGLALLAGLLLRAPPAALAVLVVPGVLALVRPAVAPEPVRIADPCEPRELPGSGGITGVIQDAALIALDEWACEFGSSREELAIALADEEAAREFEEEHGVDPRRRVGDVLRGIFGF
jgi:hypothetical protein